jgi:peptidoglycan hydrolase-like protein with peptidoglycan-binding domain
MGHRQRRMRATVVGSLVTLLASACVSVGPSEGRDDTSATPSAARSTGAERQPAPGRSTHDTASGGPGASSSTPRGRSPGDLGGDRGRGVPPPSARPDDGPGAAPPAQPTPARSTLRRGDSGAAVLDLQRRLTELGYWLGRADGRYGYLTQQAVYAIQKAAGLRRDGVVGSRTGAAIRDGVLPTPRISGDGVEIDLDRQLLIVVRAGGPTVILNTSTGNGERYTSTSGNRARALTPRGSYRVGRVVDGPVVNSLGELWRPRFFNRGIAVHGSGSIPPYAASHGCARLSNAAVDMIWAQRLMPVGSQVLVR